MNGIVYVVLQDRRSEIGKHINAYAQRPLNDYADVSSRARCLNFDLSLHLHTYFEYVINKGSGEIVRVWSLL